MEELLHPLFKEIEYAKYRIEDLKILFENHNDSTAENTKPTTIDENPTDSEFRKLKLSVYDTNKKIEDLYSHCEDNWQRQSQDINSIGLILKAVAQSVTELNSTVAELKTEIKSMAAHRGTPAVQTRTDLNDLTTQLLINRMPVEKMDEKDIDTFDGSAEKVDSWIRSVDRSILGHANRHGALDDASILLRFQNLAVPIISRRLQGAALTWHKSFIDVHPSAPYADYMEGILTRFSNPETTFIKREAFKKKVFNTEHFPAHCFPAHCHIC